MRDWLTKNNIETIIFIIMLLTAIYILYKFAKKSEQSAKYYVDVFLSELLIGFFLSKILFYIPNNNLLFEYEWTWLPYKYIDSLSSAYTGFEFFTTLPWRILYPNLNESILIGFIIVFALTPLYYLFKNRELYFGLVEAVIFASIPLILFKIVIDLYRIVVVKEFTFYAYFDINTSIFYFAFVIYVLITNFVLIKKREFDKIKFKAIRSKNNDIVKEIANWARLKKFTVTRHREGIVNNANLEDEKKDFERLWKNLK